VRQTVTIQVRLAWWVRLYLRSVVVFARLTGIEPDMDKMGAMIQRGLHTRLKAAPHEQR